MGIAPSTSQSTLGRDRKSSPSPVVSLAIIDNHLPESGPLPEALKLLVVVRDPATNRDHGDVVSVPTMRVPLSVLDAIWENACPDGQHGETVFHRGSTISNAVEDGHNALVFAVEGLMAQKLRVGDQVERGLISFRAAPFGLTVGASVSHGSERDREEIRMAGITVEIVRGAELFPPSTASYSHLAWVHVRDFVQAVARKDTSRVGLDPFRFCIYGLCIASTYDLFAYRFGLPPFSQLGIQMDDDG